MILIFGVVGHDIPGYLYGNISEFVLNTLQRFIIFNFILLFLCMFL